jgi:hypothetical protein
MNDKLWTVKKNRYSKKLRIFHSEENLSSFLDYLATSSILTEATVTLYNKREIYDGASYLKMKERAYKLNHTLDNISELEKNIINLMSYLEANNFSDKKIYKRLKSLKMLPNKFKGVVRDNRVNVLSLSDNAQYMYLVLKVHNFRTIGQSVGQLVSYKNAFNSAKKRLKSE